MTAVKDVIKHSSIRVSPDATIAEAAKLMK